MPEKNYCQTHHLFYNSTECPMCRNERLKNYENRYTKGVQTKAEKAEKDRPLTKDDLMRLTKKFNKNG
jgi:hypothetical protein